MPDEKDVVLAYYAQVLQDIRDIKARIWNFITILVVITGSILALDEATLQRVGLPLFVGTLLSAFVTWFMLGHSFYKLNKTRKNELLEKELPQIWRGRERPPDWGDRAFLVLGVVVPFLAIWLAFCKLYASSSCIWPLCR